MGLTSELFRPNTSGRWYKVKIAIRKCGKCHFRTATAQVFNSANALVGDFCGKCADLVVKARKV